MKHIKQHFFHLKVRQITDYSPYFLVKNALFFAFPKLHWSFFCPIAIYSQRKVFKQKTLLKFLDKFSSSKLLIESEKFLRNYYFYNNKSIILITISEKYKDFQRKINPIFNYFKPISTGVRTGIYNRCIICLLGKRQIIHTLEYSKPYIEKIREQLSNHCFFENLKWFFACIFESWHHRILRKITKLLRCYKQK